MCVTRRTSFAAKRGPPDSPKTTTGGAPGPPRPEARVSARKQRYELDYLSPRTRAYVSKILKKHLRPDPPRSTQIRCGSTNVTGNNDQAV